MTSRLLVILVAIATVGCGGAAPGAESTPPSAAATTFATAASSPAAPPAGDVPVCPEGDIPPGRYLVPPAVSRVPPNLTFELRDGWSGCGLTFKNVDAFGNEGPTAPGGLMLGFWTVTNVYAEPCTWLGGPADPPVGPTVADLAVALEAQAVTESEAPVAAAVDGHEGMLVRLFLPAIDVAACTGGEFHMWDGPAGAEWACSCSGWSAEIWILDVDGHRVVVQTATSPGTTDEQRAELHQVVESIDFLS